MQGERLYGKLKGNIRKILEAWDQGYRSPVEISRASGVSLKAVMRWMPLVVQLDWTRQLEEIRRELGVIRRELERTRSLVRTRLQQHELPVVNLEELRRELKEVEIEY